MFIKTTFKDSNNVQRIKDYVLKGNLYLYLAIYIYAKAIYIYIYNFCSILDRTKVPDFRRKNAYDRRNLGVYHVIYIIFGSSLVKV